MLACLLCLCVAARATVAHGEEAVPLEPVYEVIGNREVVWQAPSHPPRAVLLVAHGCSHSATDFWPASARCPSCLGLPQELNITRTALTHGWAMVAVSSGDRVRKCWRPSPPQAAPSEDMIAVKTVIDTLMARGFRSNHIESSSTADAGVIGEGTRLGSASKLPIYAMGASSGGAFVLMLAMRGDIQLAGVCSEVMALPPFLLTAHANSLKAKGDQRPSLPPTMFVHMPRDLSTASRVRMDMDLLQRQGVPVREVAIHPRPLTPDHLYIACQPEISQLQSRAIHGALSSAGYLTEHGLLAADPRQSAWRKVLKEAQVPGVDSMRLQADASPVSEELNLLWARHEIVSTTVSEMIYWFESTHASSSAMSSMAS